MSIKCHLEDSLGLQVSDWNICKCVGDKRKHENMAARAFKYATNLLQDKQQEQEGQKLGKALGMAAFPCKVYILSLSDACCEMLLGEVKEWILSLRI